MPKSKNRKKRKAYQPKTEKEDQMYEFDENGNIIGLKNNATTAEEGTTAASLERTLLDQEFDIEDFQSKSEQFVNDNKGKVLGIVGILCVIAGLWFFWSNVYKPGQQSGAVEEMFQAQQYFEIDSFRLALSGDGNYSGFLDVAENFSGSKAGNLANYYAGISYLNLGEFEEAIDYLKRFNSNDLILSGMANGAIGDAYMELGNNDQGISYYKKAATTNPNDLVSPMYLVKAGLAMERNGDLAGAKTMFEKLKAYPESEAGKDAEKYLSLVSAKMQ